MLGDADRQFVEVGLVIGEMARLQQHPAAERANGQDLNAVDDRYRALAGPSRDCQAALSEPAPTGGGHVVHGLPIARRRCQGTIGECLLQPQR
jgi:hypothetical protein